MPDVDEDGGEVSVTWVPSASVVVVVIDPSLLVTEVDESSAASSESELDPPLAPLDPSAPPEPSELAT
jgi:hypothetical protein